MKVELKKKKKAPHRPFSIPRLQCRGVRGDGQKAPRSVSLGPGACALLLSRMRLGTTRGHRAEPHSLQASGSEADDRHSDGVTRPVTGIATVSRQHKPPAGELAPRRQQELRKLTAPPRGVGTAERPEPAPPRPTPLPQAVATLQARNCHSST